MEITDLIQTKPLNILVVDDDRICRTMLQALLKKSSLAIADIQLAVSLKETVEILEKDSFDILLLDLNLTDSEGLDTLVTIYEKYPSLPIIVVTGEYDTNMGLKAVVNGAQEYLQKGHYNTEILAKSVYFAIERKKDQEAKKKIESQLLHARKLEAIGTLASGIAHDFNNMLGAMIGYMNLVLQDIEENTRAYKNLDEALIAANRAKELVRQILTFGREGEDYIGPVRIQPIIKSCLKTLQPTIPPDVDVRLNISTDFDVVMGNIMHIHRIP